MRIFLFFYENPIFKNTEIQITEIQKYKWQIYQITNYTNTELQITGIQEYKLNKYQNTNYRNTEILTDVHVRIFWLSYSDTSWEFTREIEEEKLEF